MGRAGEAKEWRGKRGGTARDGAPVEQGAQPQEVLQPLWNATDDEHFRLPGARQPKVCNACLSVCKGAQFSLLWVHDAISTRVLNDCEQKPNDAITTHMACSVGLFTSDYSLPAKPSRNNLSTPASMDNTQYRPPSDYVLSKSGRCRFDGQSNDGHSDHY